MTTSGMLIRIFTIKCIKPVKTTVIEPSITKKEHDSLDPVLIQQIQRRGLFLCLNESSQDTLGHRYTRTRNKSIHTVINDLESGAHDLFGLQLTITT